jgi:tryptophanyl-tRNA synthetase
LNVQTSRKRVFSGIQPTGAAHIGNYFGAIRGWVDNQDEHEAFYCIVDLHALTLPWSPKTLAEATVSKGAELLACGIDPDRSVLFVQSHVPEHAELAWVLSCVARMGELRRMVQFKERSKGDTESVGVGLFTYPVLQAADVLLYRAHGVPVGEDQRQHIELMRDIAQRFNSLLGKTFVLPEAWIPPAGARIMALDDPTQKMSKSSERPASVVQLIDGPDAIVKKVKSAVTDSGRDIRADEDKPALANLLTIFSVATGESIAELEQRFAGAGYGDFKLALADALVERLRPIRERYEGLMADPAETHRLLAGGAAAASAVAKRTMADVRVRCGLAPGEG